MKTYERLKDWSDSHGISAQEPSECDWNRVGFELQETYDILKEDYGVNGYVLNKLEELIEYAEAKRDDDGNGIVDAICDSRVFDGTELLKMGYDVELCDSEVLKVVESRTGQWAEGIGKFVKDKSPEAQAKWYEPDYVNNCKAKVEKTKSLFGFDKEVETYDN